MKFVVDRIEEDIVVCENTETGKMQNILLSDLKFKPHEGDVLTYINGEFILDERELKIREERIKNKFESLKRKD